MSTHEGSLLAARFAALRPEPLPGDWHDVLERAGAASAEHAQLRRSRPIKDRRRRLLLVLAAAALVVAVGTAAAFGIRIFVLDEGFIGLPPPGATPSTPRHGELVLEYVGRPALLEQPPVSASRQGDSLLHRMWVYADGRLIWDRERDGNKGLLEQHLTSEGVQLLRAEAVATGLFDHSQALVAATGYHRGWIQVRNASELVALEIETPWTLDWRDDPTRFRTATPAERRAIERLTARLTEPESWLPAGAWRDPRARAYVPSLYAVCAGGYDPSIEPGDEPPPIESSAILALLPESARNLLSTKGTLTDGCYAMETEDARSVVSMLEDAGLQRDRHSDWLAYTIETPARIRQRGWKWGVVHFEGILPEGQTVCSSCG